MGMAFVHAQGPDAGRLARVNRGLAQMLGYSEEQLLGMKAHELVHPDDAELDAEDFRRLIAGETTAYELDKRLVRADGGAIWVRVHVSLIRDAAGAPLFTVGQIVDIGALRETAGRLAAVIDTSLDAVITADAAGTILEFNPAAERMFGVSAAQVVGASVDLVVPVERRAALRRLLAGEDRELLGRRLEMNARRADGEEFPVELAITRIQADPPALQRLHPRHARRAERSAGAGGERATLSPDRGDDLGGDLDDRRRGSDDVRQPAHGGHPRLRARGAGGRRPGRAARPRFAATGRPSRCTVAGRGRRSATSVTFLRSRRPAVDVEMSATPLYDEDGSYAGSLAVVTDVTARLRAERERAELEARLHQTQRLETVGQLAGGVAHDFNNLLSVIEGYADYVEGEVADRPGAVAGIAEIRRAADRAASLTRQLLTFGRRDVAHPERVDLRSVVRDVRGLLGRTLDEQVELRLELPDEPACVEIDVHQFEQVLLNLSVNARDAMPDGGRLTLALRRRDDGCVELTAADSGTGMTDEVRARAFDPFFTTKPSGQGTGLGLATVYGIVSQAGGEVRLESEPGKGTRVVVELPGAPEAAGEADGAAGPEARPARGQTILLVEDEAPVRAMAAQILRRHGYEVVEAASAQEALASFRALDPPPDLVLTDVAMPRMSGVELAARLGKSSPPVVFMSGYTDASVDNPDVLARSAGFLQKPFSAAALLHRVGEALAGAAPSV